MHRPTGPREALRHRRNPRFGPRTTTGALAAAVAVGLTACGHSKPTATVAHLGSVPAGSTASPSAATSADPAAFSRCMRAHGINAFPDPDAQGRIQIQGSAGGALDPMSQTFKDAQKACDSLSPKHGAPNAADQKKFLDAALAYSKCMRDNGVAGFPDPQVQSGGGVGLSLGPGVNPTSPTFKSADAKCKKLMPGPPGGATTQNGSQSGKGPASGPGFNMVVTG